MSLYLPCLGGYMVYLMKNICMLLHKTKFASILLLLGFTTTFVVFLFVYGVYYQISEKKLADVNSIDFLELEVEDNSAITWKRVEQCYKKLDAYTTRAIQSVTMNAIIGENTGDYFDAFSFDYALDKKGNIAYLETNIMETNGYSGRWFTKDEFDHASRVAVGSPYEYLDMGGQEIYTKKYENNRKDEYLIDGKKYKRIGTAYLWTTPIIPVTCLDRKAQVTRIAFAFKNKSITQSQYDDLKKVFLEEFGTAIKLPKIQLQSFDKNYYFMMLSIVITIGFVCICVLSLLICYLYENQKDCIRAYRVCGVSEKKIYRFLSLEIILIASVSIIVSLPVFFGLIVPKTTEMMGYFKEGYAVMNVLFLVIIYQVINFVISYICARKEI